MPTSDQPTEPDSQALKCFEKCNQILLLSGGQAQAEGMPCDRIRVGTIRLEPSGYVVFMQTIGIKPVLQRRAPATMAEHTAIPHSSKRGNLVISSAPPRLRGQARVSSHGHRQDLVFLQVILRNSEPWCRRELVITVDGGSMAPRTPFTAEDL